MHWQVGRAWVTARTPGSPRARSPLFEGAHVEVPGKLARVGSLLPDGPRNVTGLGGSAPLSL